MTSKRFGSWAAGILLLSALFLVGKAVMVARQSGSSPIRYQAGVVQRGPIEVLATGAGTVSLADRQAVFSEVDGDVAAVLVKVGDRVKKGQELIRLVNEDVVAAVDQARLQLEQARQRLLAAGGSVAGPASGNADAAAPVSGAIVGLRVKEGDQVQRGAVLANLAAGGSVHFVAQVLEPERERIKPGQPATVMLQDFDSEIPGRVAAVGTQPIAGQTSVVYEVRIALENPGLLKAGMTGQATIQAEGAPVVRFGSVAWADTRQVTAPISGRVERVDVIEGQRVGKGQPIALIANETWPAETEQLRLAVTQAEMNLRDKEAQREKLIIRAPADGVVIAVNAKAGDRVNGGARASSGTAAAGGGELVAVASGDSAMATVAVDEMEVAKVRVGQKATVTLSALPGKTFDGRVEQVSLEGKSQNGVTTYDVEVRIEGSEGVRSGMTATASIHVDGRQNALLVPVEALSETANGPTVRVLDGGQPRAVPVKIGLRNDRYAEVLSGLREGDRVVVAEYDAAAATQNFTGQRSQFGPGGFPGGGLLGRPGGFGGAGGGAGGSRGGGAAR